MLIWGTFGPMTEDASNMGKGYFQRCRLEGYQASPDEREYAFYAHLASAVAAFLFCGMLIPIAAPLLPYMLAKEKGPFLLFHTNQALVFQIAIVALNFIIATVATVGSFFCIGALVWLIYPITWLAGAVVPLLIAFRTRGGEWAEYPVVGVKVLQEWNPLIKS